VSKKRYRPVLRYAGPRADVQFGCGTSPSQPERWLGLRPTAPKTDRRGRTYPGRILKTISVENAGRLA
jgi:hypothetical protein